MSFTTIGTDLKTAKAILDAGELVAIPTETVYGLAANALNDEAVIKIFKAKNRPQFNPLILHLPFWNDVKKYVNFIPEKANELANLFSPGPITFLLQKKNIVPDLITAGHSKVAIRIPAHPLTLQLLRSLNYPLAAPSANPFGYVSPTTAAHVMHGLENKISYILNGGSSTVGLESTIVDFEGDKVIIRRNGGISRESIETVLNEKVFLETSANEHPVAPGQLMSHYATATPLLVGVSADLLSKFPGQKIIVIGFGNVDCSPGFNLSEKGDTDEAARHLFEMMRRADAANADLIIAPKLPNAGLGRAINDRLIRAQHHLKN